MDDRSLGRGRISVPVVGLGTWRRLEAAAAGRHRELISTAVTAGIRLFDTSPMAGDPGLGVLLMRPLGGGDLTRRPPRQDELEPLRPFGVTTWGQALIKWGLSDPRVHVSLPATAQPARLAENAAAGSSPWFGPDE